MKTAQALWAEGVSALEIGRRMGVSKDMAVGRLRRAGARPRPSPIVSNDQEPQPRPRYIGAGPTLPPLPSLQPKAPENGQQAE